MTVIKLTASKKGVLIITDEGVPYVTSVNSIMYLLGGKAKGDFITTKRLPHTVNDGRFKPSELYDPTGMANQKTLDPTVRNANDGLSISFKETQKQKKGYTDKKVW